LTGSRFPGKSKAAFGPLFCVLRNSAKMSMLGGVAAMQHPVHNRFTPVPSSVQGFSAVLRRCRVGLVQPAPPLMPKLSL
jgi:hypothetical protein